MTIDDEVFTDLKASLEWALTLELSDEQRARISHLCHKIAGAQPHLGGSRRSQTRDEQLEAELVALRGKKRWWQF